jgi:hypothetical protein
MSSFTEFFSLDKLRIILMSNYDINHGSNIIFLPARRQFMWVNQLPRLWSDHKQYTKKVKHIYKKSVKKKLRELLKKQIPCENSVTVDVEKQLYSIEEDQFLLLVDLGPKRLV